MHALPAPIRFDRTAIVLGGGWVDTALLDRLLAAGYPLVAADGGANGLAEAGICPDAIVGDLDSLADPRGWRQRTRVVHLAEQDTTDFEKCLYSVDAPGFVGLGFTGKRLDHTLSALHVMLRCSTTSPVVLAAAEDWIGVPHRDIRLRVPSGSRVSLFPLTPTSFLRSEGLQYPLDGLRLVAGEQVGTSNCAVDGAVEIVFDPEAQPGCALLLPRSSFDDPEGFLSAL